MAAKIETRKIIFVPAGNGDGAIGGTDGMAQRTDGAIGGGRKVDDGCVGGCVSPDASAALTH